MFNKLAKGGPQVPYAPGGGPERSNWYPQLYSPQPQQQQQLFGHFPYQHYAGMQYPK